ncbi:MAG TPA: hypothetical protein PLR71_01895 [Deltaproteobacteria bacterium]|nr:hypothetical protein [Deltaproteobacteria bacterium]HQI80285.1 hypothetical protein [Deltaproteobacteria bacterium]
MDEAANTGLIEGRTRVAEELLASTTFKDSLRMFLRNIDPGAGPGLVRTILGKDTEVPLAVMSSLPAMANCLIGIAMELVVQVRSIYPPPLLAGMVASLLEDVDRRSLACLIHELRDLGRDLAPAFSAFAKAVEEQSLKGKEST